MAKCNKYCFNCTFPDCINDDVYPEKSLYKYRTEEQKQYQRDYAKKKREEARVKGLCIVCRQNRATYGVKCYECYLRQKRHDKKKNKHIREYRKENELCYFCGDKPLEGYKVCEKHYKITLNNIVKVNQSETSKQFRKDISRYIFGNKIRNKVIRNDL